MMTLILFTHSGFAEDQMLYGFGFGSGKINDFRKAIHGRVALTTLYANGLAGEGELTLTTAQAIDSEKSALLKFSTNLSLLKYFKPYSNVLPYSGAHLGINFMSEPFDSLMVGYGLKAGIVIKGLDPYLLKIEAKQSFINNNELDPLMFTMTLEKPLKTRFFKSKRFIKRRIKKVKDV